MARRIKDEDGRIYVEKKKGGCLKWLVIIAILFAIGKFFGDKTETTDRKTIRNEVARVEITTVEETTVEEITVEETEVEDADEDLRKYDKEANADFANYMMKSINDQLANEGINEQVQLEYYDNTLLYVILPQDYKYLSNAEIQQVADAMLDVKKAKFFEFALENEYPADGAPVLYVKTADGTVLAEESIWNGTMERKHEN